MGMSLTRKIALNSAVQIVGKVLSTILGLIVIGLITRALGTEKFGHYATALAFVQVFGILVDFGLYIVLVKKISEDEANAPAWINTAFTLRLYTAVGFLILAPLIALFTAYPGEVKSAVAIATLSTLAITLNQVLTGIFQKALRMDRVAIAELLGRVVLLGLTIWVAKVHPTVNWVMLTVAAGSVVNFIFIFVFSRKFVKIRLNLEKEKVRIILKEGWPIALSVVFNLVYFKANTLILAAVRPASEVGLYGAANKVLEVLTTFPAMFAGLLTPLLAAAYAAKDLNRFKTIIQKAFDNLLLLATPLALGTGFVAHQVMYFVGGSEFTPAAPVLTILMVATACIFFGNLFANAVVTVNAQRKMLWGYGSVAVGSLVIYLLTIPRFGLYGAATTAFISELTIALTAAYLVFRATNIKLEYKILFKNLLACLPMLGALALTPNLHLLFRLALAAGAYLAGLWLFRIFPVTIMKEIFSRINYARRD
ncbi:flippase [Candidatus Parcubacteria bacterium]|jgi:O-antigen/teichoic acid export membrane protein|nr:MAG: flippase [Candidatus Parcubacteria bacterium]